MPLKETECIEGDTVTLTCEVNLPDRPARWFKDRQEIFPSDTCILKVEGTVHTLTIPSASLEAEAEYTICIDGKSSTALLLVEGIVHCIQPF